MALAQTELPELKRFTFFVSRRFEEGRERFRLHMGHFATLAEAEEWLSVVREIYPGAWAGEAPGRKLRERATAAAAAQAQYAAGPQPAHSVTPARAPARRPPLHTGTHARTRPACGTAAATDRRTEGRGTGGPRPYTCRSHRKHTLKPAPAAPAAKPVHAKPAAQAARPAVTTAVAAAPAAQSAVRKSVPQPVTVAKAAAPIAKREPPVAKVPPVAAKERTCAREASAGAEPGGRGGSPLLPHSTLPKLPHRPSPRAAAPSRSNRCSRIPTSVRS